MKSLSYTLRRRRNEWGEFVIRCYVNGRRYPDGDYFTDDWTDAAQTLTYLQEQARCSSPSQSPDHVRVPVRAGTLLALVRQAAQGGCPRVLARVLIFRRPADTTPVYKDWLANDFPADAKSAAFFFSKAIEHGSIA